MLPPCYGLRINTVALGQRPHALLTMLYCASRSIGYYLSCRGSAVKNLAHNASFHSMVKIVPSLEGTEHLASRYLEELVIVCALYFLAEGFDIDHLHDFIVTIDRKSRRNVGARLFQAGTIPVTSGSSVPNGTSGLRHRPSGTSIRSSLPDSPT